MDDKEFEIACLKCELEDLNSIIFQFIDGEITAEEYEPTRLRRLEIRQLIREKEKQ